jgi:protein CpxP
MKRLIWVGLALQLCAVPCFAQTAAPASPAQNGGNGGVPGGFTGVAVPSAPGSASTVSNQGLAQGANSFTEGQARSRLKNNGYSQVSALTKGDDGIWRGSAMKDGATIHVSVDFKGDISMD